MASNNWKLDSWKNYELKHIPEYSDISKLDSIINQLKDNSRVRASKTTGEVIE